MHFFNFTIYSTLVYQCCEWCYVTSQVFQYSCSDEIESTCLVWIITLCRNLLPSPSSMWMLRDWWITVLVLGRGMYLLWSKLICTACLWCLLCLLGCGAFFSFLWCYAVVGLSKCLSDIIPEYLVYVFQSDCLHSHIYLCVQWFALFCIHVNVVSLYVTFCLHVYFPYFFVYLTS